jgi:hypothetical protein
MKWRYLILPGIPVAAIVSANLGAEQRMTLLHLSGVLLEVLALYVAMSLYITARLGTYMHASPYVVLLVGAILLVLAPDIKSPLAVTVTFLCFTLVVHAAVYYDMQSDKKG